MSITENVLLKRYFSIKINKKINLTNFVSLPWKLDNQYYHKFTYQTFENRNFKYLFDLKNRRNVVTTL